MCADGLLGIGSRLASQMPFIGSSAWIPVSQYLPPSVGYSSRLVEVVTVEECQ